jgi:putative transposase
MSRLARVVVPGLAHHVTQRGNGRQQTFVDDADSAQYLYLLTASCLASRVSCFAYSLMPTHVHRLLVPATSDGLRRCLSVGHHADARAMNARRGVSGHVWQGRCGSVPMDAPHLNDALCSVLVHPVRAELALTAEAWEGSSAGAYLRGARDGLTNPWRMLGVIGAVPGYLASPPDAVRIERLRVAETIGRPAAEADFLGRLGQDTGRRMRPRRRGAPARPPAAPERAAPTVTSSIERAQ